jgi:hypothetical protein
MNAHLFLTLVFLCEALKTPSARQDHVCFYLFRSSLFIMPLWPVLVVSRKAFLLSPQLLLFPSLLFSPQKQYGCSV